MSTADTARVLALLDTERRMLLATASAVPPRFRERRPATGRWSVAEVIDHLARVEEGVATLLAARGATAPAAPADEAVLAAAQLTPERIANLRNRRMLFEAPERVRPGAEPDFDTAVQRVARAREALLAALGACDPVALRQVTYVHPALGRLTLEGWVESVAHHEARHAAQITEIAEALRSGEVAPA
jgi:hypothetical protein